jgi:hypothetical protein
VSRIFIHTAGLIGIHPFGKRVFQSHLSEVCPETNLIFTGEHTGEFFIG